MNRTRQDSIQSFAFVISACVAVGLCCGFVSNPGAGDGPSNHNGTELVGRINPNNAPVESLARLPGLGPARAGAIVAYRDNYRRGPAFKSGRDLQNVTGIGPKTVQSINDLIKFE